MLDAKKQWTMSSKFWQRMHFKRFLYPARVFTSYEGSINISKWIKAYKVFIKLIKMCSNEMKKQIHRRKIWDSGSYRFEPKECRREIFGDVIWKAYRVMIPDLNQWTNICRKEISRTNGSHCVEQLGLWKDLMVYWSYKHAQHKIESSGITGGKATSQSEGPNWKLLVAISIDNPDDFLKKRLFLSKDIMSSRIF